MGHMSRSRQFAIMSLHAGQKNYHEVCPIFLLHSAILSIDCGKGSRSMGAMIKQDTIIISLFSKLEKSHFSLICKIHNTLSSKC